LKTANAIGDGLYGVDIKSVNGKSVLIEVNDNPNLDRGVEDLVLGDELYERVMRVFRARVDAGKQPKSQQ
jgi:glutathione synthase/RimK-type ligase-like ATP-grasp enzyme